MLISSVIDMDRPEKQRRIPEVESLCGEPLKRVVAQKQQRSVMEKFLRSPQ